MATANLSVGINTEKAHKDLKDLKDFMRSQLSSMALSINEKSLEASIKKAMLGPTSTGYTLKINAAQLKTDVQDALKGVAGGKVDAGTLDTTKIEQQSKHLSQILATATTEAHIGDRVAKDLKDKTPAIVKAAADLGKAAGEAEGASAKMARDSYRVKNGAATTGFSEPSKLTAEQVKARAEQAKSDADSKAALLKRIDMMRVEFDLKKKANAEELKAFTASQAKEGLAEMRARAQAWSNVATEATKAERAQKAAAARLFAEGKNLAPDNLTAKGKAQYGAQYAISKGVSESMLPNGAAGLLQVTDGINKVGKAHQEATGHTKTHAAAMRDAHSAARGLASGMGMMWLTWGNIAPLLAGASLSHGFIQAMKAGTEFAYQLTFVKALGGETSEAVRGIGAAALEMSKSGLYGPVELANGLRVLNQAGISTKDSMLALPQVFQLATVGEMSMADAAITLAGVMTAFSMQVKDMSHIGDVFAKAAAVSQTSVEQMTQAMKTASVVGEQYGASMEDTATALTLLAKLNITGTAAGTSLRNMLKELYTPTEKAAGIMKNLGLSAQTAAGELKPFPEIIFALKGKLEQFNKASQTKILQGMFGERGAKEAMAMLSQTEEQWAKLNQTISESSGFMAKVSSELEATVKGSFKQAVNTLQASLIEAFNNSEGAAGKLAAQLKNTFNSESFKSAISGIVTGVLGLTNVLVAHAELLATVGAAWVALQLTVAARAAWVAAAALITNVSMELKAFTAIASGAAVVGGTVNAAMGTVSGGATGLAAALKMVTNPVALLVTGLAAVAAGLVYLYSKMSENSVAESLTNRTNNLATAMENLRVKTANASVELRKQIALKRGGADPTGYEGEVKQAKAELGELQKQKKDIMESPSVGRRIVGQMVKLPTIADAIVNAQAKLEQAETARVAALGNMKAFNTDSLQDTINEARDSVRGVNEKKLSPKQVAELKAFRERLVAIETNASSILADAGSGFVSALNKDLSETAQSVKTIAGTRSSDEVMGGGGGGRADREAAKLENANVLDLEKRYQAELKTADAHYAKLEKIESASAQYGIKTREEAENKISELTEQHWSERLEKVSKMSDEMSALLGGSVKLTEADAQKARTFIATAKEEINTLKEKIEWKKIEAQLKTQGEEVRFNKDLREANDELSKEQALRRQKIYGKAEDPIARARNEGELAAELKYTKLRTEAEEKLRIAILGGDKAAIESAERRRDTVLETIAQQKAAMADMFEADIRYMQSAEYGWNQFWTKYQENATTAAKVVEQSLDSVTKHVEDAFSEMFTTGKFDYKKMVDAILADTARLVAKMAVADLGRILTGKGTNSNDILGSILGSIGGGPKGGTSNMAAPGTSPFGPTMGAAASGEGNILTKAVEGLKGFWNSLTGATNATEKSTTSVVEGVAKTLTKTTVDTSATAAMTELAAAAQMAATNLSMISGTGGGGGSSGLGALGSLFSGGGGSSLSSTAATYGTNVGSQQTAMLAAQEAGMSSGGFWSSVGRAIVGLFAKDGAAFSDSARIKAFAQGGTFTNKVVNSPTLFRFADGTGMMGEAGPEAIMPLTRDSQGRLGVRYEGREAPSSSRNTNVNNVTNNISINAPGGDPAQIRRSGAAVARQVGGAVAASARYR